jgi:hypothetical protein
MPKRFQNEIRHEVRFMTDVTADKKADLAGPGISTYEKVEKILPDDYAPILTRKETMKALYMVKSYIE